MTRKELYDKIKKLGAQDTIKAKFGDNFTRVSSANLESFLKDFDKPTKVNKKVVVVSASHGTEIAIIKLVSTLQAKKILTAKEANEVASLLK